MKKENIRAKKSDKKKKGQRMSAANNKLLKLVDDAGMLQVPIRIN